MISSAILFQIGYAWAIKMTVFKQLILYKALMERLIQNRVEEVMRR